MKPANPKLPVPCLILFGSFLMLVGCGGRSVVGYLPADGGAADSATDHGSVARDTGRTDRGRVPDRNHVGLDTSLPGPLGCKNDCYDYVIHWLDLPTNGTLSEKYALLYNGKKYNGLGSLLSILIQVLPPPKTYPTAESICTGQGLNLLRIRTASISATASIKGQAFTAKADCCSGASCANLSSGKCSAAAQAKCFSGSAALTPDLVQAPISGVQAGSKFTLTGKTFKLKLGLMAGQAPVVLDLIIPQVKGEIYQDTLDEGVVAGALSNTYITKVLLPYFANLINDFLNDPSTDPSVKKMYLQIFDPDGDGKVTAEELGKNPLVKSILGGDLDVDGDGLKDLTLGLGMRAVRCKIQSP